MRNAALLVLLIAPAIATPGAAQPSAGEVSAPISQPVAGQVPVPTPQPSAPAPVPQPNAPPGNAAPEPDSADPAPAPASEPAAAVIEPATAVRAESTPPAPALVGREAPAPLTLPELVARNRWSISAGTLAILDTIGIALDGAVTYARGPLELFGSASMFAFAGICIEGCSAGDDGQVALGNTRAGARYVLALGPIAIAPAVWAWLPTTTAGPGTWWPRARAVTMSADDSRTFLIDAALGTAIDVGWRGEHAFAQAELGTALVADGGPQIDNVFAALAAGARVSTNTSLLAEWRVDAYPREALIHAVGAGMSRGDGDRRMWRLRGHVMRGGTAGARDLGVNGLTLGFDLVQRW